MTKPQLDQELIRYDRRIMVEYWFAIAIAVALAPLGAMHAVVQSLGDVAFQETTDLIAVQQLRIADEMRGHKARRFMLTANAEYLSKLDPSPRGPRPAAHDAVEDSASSAVAAPMRELDDKIILPSP